MLLQMLCHFNTDEVNLLTHSMVQSPSWEANWFEASQEIPRISRNPKVHYCTHKCPPTVPIMGQPNPVHIPTSHLLEIWPNIIHPSMPMSPQWSLSLRFPHQDPIHPLSSPIRATCPVHLIFLNFITRTILGEGYKSFSSSLCTPPFPHSVMKFRDKKWKLPTLGSATFLLTKSSTVILLGISFCKGKIFCSILLCSILQFPAM